MEEHPAAATSATTPTRLPYLDYLGILKGMVAAPEGPANHELPQFHVLLHPVWEVTLTA